MFFEEDEVFIEDLVRNGVINFIVGFIFILLFGDVVVIQLELLYVQKGGLSIYLFVGVEMINELKYNYLDIFLLLCFSLGDMYGEGLGIYFNGGFYVVYVFSGKSIIEMLLGMVEIEFIFDDVDDQKCIDYGFVFGGGLIFGNLFFDVCYNYGINNLFDDDVDNLNDEGFKKLQYCGVVFIVGLIF